MDPLGMTASLIAINTAAATALKISKLLYDLARGYKSAAEEIENFALDLRSFASVVRLGQGSLERHHKKAPLSEVLRYIESLDVLNQLALQSKRTTMSVERVWEQTRSLQKDNVLTKLKWLAKKSEVRGLKPDMESLKSSLHLVMAAITMEALQKSGSEDLQEEIKALKQQIQMQLETIQFLQESQERQRVEFGEASGSSPFIFMDPATQVALVGLGEIMVKNGRVPDIGDHGRSSPQYGEGQIQSAQLLQPIPRWNPPKSVEPPKPVTPPEPIDPALQNADIVSFNKITPFEYISGFISGSTRQNVSQRAGVARSLRYNIISESLANQLGRTYSFSEIPNVWIDFGNGRVERCIGQTELTWKRDDKEFTIFGLTWGYIQTDKVQCLIFRSGVPEITLGKDNETFRFLFP